jgi:hypothetical protein
MEDDKTYKPGELPNVDQILKDLQAKVGRRLVLTPKTLERLVAQREAQPAADATTLGIGCYGTDICILCDQSDYCPTCDAMDWCVSVDTH